MLVPHSARSTFHWSSDLPLGRDSEGMVPWFPDPSLLLERAWEDLGQEKLFSYHLKTGMKCFSKASLQATATSRAIPAFLWLALPMKGGQGAAWELIYCPCRQGASELKAILCLLYHGAHLQGSLGAWAAPAQIFGLCRQEHPFGEDFVCVQKEIYCLCKAVPDRLMKNMPAPSCDLKQREGKHSIFIFSAAALSWSFFFLFVFGFFFFSLPETGIWMLCAPQTLPQAVSSNQTE